MVIGYWLLVIGRRRRRRHLALGIRHWKAPKALSLVVRIQSLETGILFSRRPRSRTKKTFFPNENHGSAGSYNQAPVPRLFSFSLLRFFSLFVAKTKRKRNEGERHKNNRASVKVRIQGFNREESLLPSASVDPAVKPRNDGIPPSSKRSTIDHRPSTFLSALLSGYPLAVTRYSLSSESL